MPLCEHASPQVHDVRRARRNMFARLSVCLVLACMSGCATIGHNETFMLQYKEDLRHLYEKGGEDVAAAERPIARELALGSTYRSNLPFSLTDRYDARAKQTPIRAGDPLNIIINRIYVKDNGQRSWLFENSSDIAVVVTVDDGRSAEPKNVLVAYEQNVGSSVKIPVDDLVGYSTESYNNEPVRIEVTVLALYALRNRTYVQILTAAAGIGAALSPAYAPATSAASQIGKVVINSKQDRVLAKVAFQLYPSKVGKEPVIESVGVPRVAVGQYLLLSTPTPQEIGDSENIHLNFDLTPYRVGQTKVPREELRKVLLEKKVPEWPVDPERDSDRKRLDMTHVVLTVDNTRLSNAQQIIARADSANRALAELARDAVISTGKVSIVDEQLVDLRSKIRLQLGQSEFSRHRREPNSVTRLFALYEDKSLAESDKLTVLQMINEVLPDVIPGDVRSDAAKLRQWFQQNKDALVYDQRSGRYVIAKK